MCHIGMAYGDTSNTFFCVETAKPSLKLIFIISSVYDACKYEYCDSFYECLPIYLFFSEMVLE